MYAIIQTGGKQYRVTPGDILAVERLDGKLGDVITFKDILLVGGSTDNKVHVGAPFVANASTHAEIVEDSLGEKLLTIKYRRRKGYRRTIGHRQQLTRLLITKIDNGNGGSLQFDAAKRNEVLIKASVKFSKREELRSSKQGAAPKKAAAPVKKEAKAAKPAAPKATAAKKTTKAKKAE